jgi:Zn-dependent peptidase ImmA (M78 family)
MTPPAKGLAKRFTGARLRLARHLRALTQTDLAAIVGVSHQFIGYLEAGAKEPSDVLVRAVGAALGFDVEFFYLPAPDESTDEECYFRRRHSTPVAVRNQVLAHTTLFGELLGYLELRLQLPESSLPTIRVANRDQIEHAAERCRMLWALGRDVPIKNVTRVLENAGVAVTRFEGLSEKVDAFSRIGQPSVIVLNDKAPSRSRWDLAHECGHLVMHGGMSPETVEAEQEAHYFAGALLMPRAGFVREFPRTRRIDWERLFRLKRRWRVSLAALVRRAFDLDLIDALRYRQAYKYMSMRGWLRDEPDEVEPEPPELIDVAFRELRQTFGITPAEVAKSLYWNRETFVTITGVEIPSVSSATESPDNIVDIRSRAHHASFRRRRSRTGS